jgi:hypothetical protein
MCRCKLGKHHGLIKAVEELRTKERIHLAKVRIESQNVSSGKGLLGHTSLVIGPFSRLMQFWGSHICHHRGRGLGRNTRESYFTTLSMILQEMSCPKIRGQNHL